MRRNTKKYIRAGLIATVFGAMLICGACGKEESTGFQPRLDTEKSVVLSTTGFFGNFEALDQVTNDFNKYYPNVEFTYEQVGIDNFEGYLDANPNVDIMMTSEEIFDKLGPKVEDICVDLSKEDVDLSDIDEKMLKMGYHSGKLSCIPMGQNMYGLVVNETLLEKEGLSVPQTYDEFLSALKTLKEKGYTPIQGPNSKVYAELTESMAFDMILNDKDLYQDLMDGKESAAEALQPVFDKIDAILDGGYIDETVNDTYPDDNYDQAILNFFEGDVPFWVCNTEKVSGMKKRESKSEAFQADPFEYTYIYAPLGEKGAYAFKEPWFGFAANKNSDNSDYAVEFIRFLATKDEINNIAEIKGVPSVAAEKNDIEIYKNVSNPEKVQMDCLNEGEITPAMVTNWYSAVNKYVTGEFATGKEALTYFAKQCSES